MASRLKSKVNAQMAYINAYVIFGEVTHHPLVIVLNNSRFSSPETPRLKIGRI